MRDLAATPSANPSNGDSLALMRRDSATKLVFAVLVVYLITNRSIPDEYVLPMDVSIRVSQLVLIGLGLALVLAMAMDVRPLPRGIVGALGLLTVAMLLTMPFAQALAMDKIESAAAQRGVVTVVLLTVLFLSGYYVAHNRARASQLLAIIVGLTIIQAAIGVYESFSGVYVRQSWQFLRLGFLVDDPNLDRDLIFGLFRAGGGRPVATTSHPIVLSSLLALAIVLILGMYPSVKSRRLRLALLPSVALMLAAMVALHTRTGFVILLVAGLFSVTLALRHHADSIIRFGLAGLAAVVVVVLALPSSARAVLNLFARLGNDGSVGSRTSDYDIIPEILARRPFIGLGYMTRQPLELTLDNSYLDSLIEFGIVGLAIVVVFLVAVTVRPMLVAIRQQSYEDGPVLIAAVAGGVALLTAMALFDALKFEQFLPTTLLLMGMGLATADRALRRASRVPPNPAEAQLDDHEDQASVPWMSAQESH